MMLVCDKTKQVDDGGSVATYYIILLSKLDGDETELFYDHTLHLSYDAADDFVEFIEASVNEWLKAPLVHEERDRGPEYEGSSVQAVVDTAIPLQTRIDAAKKEAPVLQTQTQNEEHSYTVYAHHEGEPYPRTIFTGQSEQSTLRKQLQDYVTANPRVAQIEQYAHGQDKPKTVFIKGKGWS